MVDINELISNPKNFSTVGTNDFGYISNKLFDHLENRINILADRTYSKLTSGSLSVPKEAFKQSAKAAIGKAVVSYVSGKKWSSNTPILPYMITVINRLSKSTISDATCPNNKVAKNVCPACKESRVRHVLDVDGGNNLICSNCIQQIEAIEMELVELKACMEQ